MRCINVLGIYNTYEYLTRWCVFDIGGKLRAFLTGTFKRVCGGKEMLGRTKEKRVPPTYHIPVPVWSYVYLNYRDMLCRLQVHNTSCRDLFKYTGEPTAAYGSNLHNNIVLKCKFDVIHNFVYTLAGDVDDNFFYRFIIIDPQK